MFVAPKTIGQLFVLALLLAASPLAGQVPPFSGECVGVRDGDSLLVLPDGQARPVEIRLEGIDAPEKGQPFSDKAKKRVAQLAYGERVRVTGKEIDRHGRLVARVLVRASGVDLSVRLVRSGLAWHYTRYSDDPELAAAERAAREADLGLWSLPNPLPPWEARELERSAREADRSGEKRPGKDVVYHGNRKSHVFHAPWCRWYGCKNCTIELDSREEANRRGFRPCGICDP